MKVFISYSHKDDRALDRLHTHFAMLRQEGKITEWFDREILAGGEFNQEISEQLESCHLFLPLVSPDFLASNYCYEKEMTRALERRSAGVVHVVPIIIEPCDWKASPLGELKALPRDGKPVVEWPNENAAFLDVVTELRRILSKNNVASPKGAAELLWPEFLKQAGVSPGSPRSSLRGIANQSEESGQTQDKPGIERFEGKVSDVPPPQTPSLTDEVVFDYSSHNGHYIIGRGQLEFETRWSKASDTSIRVYNDPPSINGVAVAKGCTSIAQVINAESLDYTSRTRTPQRGEIVVLRNVNGFYAAVHVLDIKDDTRADDRDEVRFRYAIQSNGSDNFAEFNQDVVTKPEDGVSAPVPTPADETGRASSVKQAFEERRGLFESRLQAWFSECLERWKTLTRDLAPGNIARFPKGYYAAAYILADVQQPLEGAQLLEALRLGEVRHTGWPPFLVLTESDLKPYRHDGNVECWIGGAVQDHGPASADFWRVSLDGMFFLIRGYEEDGHEEEQIAPGTIFDLSFPTWRLGEILLPCLKYGPPV